jgi:hypothetical protein
MKLYRLYTGCEGEYSCDNYLGLFKTIDSMLSFVECNVKEMSDFNLEEDDRNPTVTLNSKQEIVVENVELWYTEYMYEIIDTDSLI